MKGMSDLAEKMIYMAFGLIVAIIVVVGFYYLIVESIHTACWANSKKDFANLFLGLKKGEGEKDISLGNCVGKVYLIKKDSNGDIPDIKSEVNVFSCGTDKLNDPEYQSFAIIDPRGDLKITDVGERDVREGLLKTECIPYEKKMNELVISGKTTNNAIMEGNRKYCVSIGFPALPSGKPVSDDIKNVYITEGECG